MSFAEKQVPSGVQCQKQSGEDRRRATSQDARRELRLITSHYVTVRYVHGGTRKHIFLFEEEFEDRSENKFTRPMIP